MMTKPINYIFEVGIDCADSLVKLLGHPTSNSYSTDATSYLCRGRPISASCILLAHMA
jgi:hypothetical protein